MLTEKALFQGIAVDELTEIQIFMQPSNGQTILDAVTVFVTDDFSRPNNVINVDL